MPLISPFLPWRVSSIIAPQGKLLGRTMAVEWYLQDLRGQYGPLGTTELRKELAGYASLENVFIWRQGFQDWKAVAEVFESFDAPAALKQRKRVEGRWALYGLALGTVLFATDIVFEWRSPYLPWTGNEFENIDRAAAAVGIPAFLFFLAGAIKDAFFSHWKIRGKLSDFAAETPQPTTPERTAHRYNNFVAKNWRGEYPLFVSYWVFGVLGNFVLGLIHFGSAAAYNAKMGFQPTYVFTFILGVWLASDATQSAKSRSRKELSGRQQTGPTPMRLAGRSGRSFPAGLPQKA